MKKGDRIIRTDNQAVMRQHILRRKSILIILNFIITYFIVLMFVSVASSTEVHAEYKDSPTTKYELEPELDDEGNAIGLHTVKFAEKEWEVLGYNGVGDTYDKDDTLITLFAKSSWDSTEFGEDSCYKNSIVCRVLEDYVTNPSIFTEAERKAIVERTLSGGPDSGDENSDYISGDDVKAKLWLLSAFEANKVKNAINSPGIFGETIWLRSPVSEYYVFCLTSNSFISCSTVEIGYGTRPALQLNLDKICYNPQNNTIDTFLASPTTKYELHPKLDHLGKVTAAHEVFFAGREWYVLGYNGIGDIYHDGDKFITLFALLGNGSIFSNSSNTYHGSCIESYLENYYSDYLFPQEREAIVERTLTGGANTGDANSDYISGEEVKAKLWPLSAFEASKIDPLIGSPSTKWWLRSPGKNKNETAYYQYIAYPNIIQYADIDYYDYSFPIGISAAVQLNLSSVTFLPDTKAFVTPKTDISNAIVTVDATDVAVTVKIGEDIIDSSNYYDELYKKNGNTYEKNEGRITPGIYKYKITANSRGYEGTIYSEEFEIKDKLVDKNKCGPRLTYEIYDTRDGAYSLIISGTGNMFDYSSSDEDVSPWSGYNITRVEIKEGVTSIGSYAFNNSKIESITMPKSMRSIGNCSFYTCESLSDVKLNEGLESIGTSAFSMRNDLYDYEDKLESIVIPKSVKTIGSSAFYDRDNLTSVTINEGVESIEGYAFHGCGINDITIPGSVKSIGANAFEWCINLSGIEFNDGLKKIEISAFNGCSSLSSVIFNADLENIGESAFCGTNIDNISIPGSVCKIGKTAFKKCENLSSVSLNEGIESIEEEAFNECTGLNEIVIPGTVKNMGSRIFSFCSSLKKVTINNGVKEISNGAFYKCRNLETIYIPITVAKIKENALSNTSIDNIYYDGTEGTWNDIYIEYGNDIIDSAIIHYSGILPYYTVCFDTDGGTEVMDQRIKHGECASVPESPQKHGYTFYRWCYYPDPDDYWSETKVFDFSTPITSDLTLYAEWEEADEYDIRFDTGEGSLVDSQTVYKGDKVIKPSNPTWEGYVFSGWFVDEDFEQEFDFDTEINSDLTLYAKWIKEEKKEKEEKEEKEDHDNFHHDYPDNSDDINPSAITTTDNKPLHPVSVTHSSYQISYYRDIPFWGKSKLSIGNFGKMTVSVNGREYEVTKIKVNKKKRLICITGLSGADKATVKAVKKATKGANGLPFTVNPYYVNDTDQVSIKRKNDGSIKSVKVRIFGKDYKAKKGEFKYDVTEKVILFNSSNLNGSYHVG